MLSNQTQTLLRDDDVITSKVLREWHSVGEKYHHEMAWIIEWKSYAPVTSLDFLLSSAVVYMLLRQRN